MMTPLEQVRFLLGDEEAEKAGDSLLGLLVQRAEGRIKGYCNRTDIPEALEPVVAELAVIAYSQIGIEGESSHSEGGVSRSMWAGGIPPDLQAQLAAYRRGTVLPL